jgi:hypothetical protein
MAPTNSHCITPPLPHIFFGIVDHFLTTEITDFVRWKAHHLLIDIERTSALGTFAVLLFDLGLCPFALLAHGDAMLFDDVFGFCSTILNGAPELGDDRLVPTTQ